MYCLEGRVHRTSVNRPATQRPRLSLRDLEPKYWGFILGSLFNTLSREEDARSLMLLSRCTRVSKAFCAAAYCSVQAVAVSVVSSRLSKCPPWHRMVSVERVDISTVDQTGPLVDRCCPFGTQPDEVTLVVQLHSLRSVSAGACVSCPSMAPGLTHEASRCGVRDATAHVPCATLRRRSGFVCSSQRSAEHGALAPTQMRFASCSTGTAGTRRASHCLFWLKFAPWE
jgi:hypothetical protein